MNMWLAAIGTLLPVTFGLTVLTSVWSTINHLA